MEQSPAMTAAASARLWFGTMGFSYSDWAGVFYPPGTKPGDYLSYYARHFDTVELDTTFHATPPVDRVRRWVDVTPPSFRFCVKTPRDVTHEGSVARRVGPMLQFIDVMRAFGPKLSAVLIQLPPSCGIDQFDDLDTLLSALPTDVRFAVEFRNGTWGEQRTLDLLRQHGTALVVAEYLSRPRRLHLTADFTYVRWIGQHERFAELNREQLDVSANLEWWQAEIDRVRPQLKDVFGFFNNDYSGYSIATCRRFMRRMGLEVQDPLEDAAGQGKLFG
jgi:uncharacterized protein YecE (DUF72 family)